MPELSIKDIAKQMRQHKLLKDLKTKQIDEFLEEFLKATRDIVETKANARFIGTFELSGQGRKVTKGTVVDGPAMGNKVGLDINYGPRIKPTTDFKALLNG